MKTKTSILTLTKVSFILFIIYYFLSCAGSENDINPEKNYEIKIIDSCEYIYVSRRPFASEFSITHKGNCKYCTKRYLK